MAGLKISSTKEMKKRDGEKGTENHFFPPLLVVDKTRAAVGALGEIIRILGWFGGDSLLCEPNCRQLVARHCLTRH
jgi:hypothetical protein